MSDLNFSRPNKDTKLGESNVKFFIGKVVGYNSMKEQIEKGSGWYYKVRILGDHGIKDEIPDEQLDYVQSLLPTTAGSGAAYKMRSVRISQGDTVFGIRGGGKGGKPFIIAVFPRTRNTKISNGKFGTLSGFYGSLKNNQTLSGEFNDQIGPTTPGVQKVKPEEWTKATAKPSSDNLSKLGFDKNQEGDLTEEDTDKKVVKKTVKTAQEYVKDKEDGKGDAVNNEETLEQINEAGLKTDINPNDAIEANKVAVKQGLQDEVIAEEKNQKLKEQLPKFKDKVADKINKIPTFDSWEKRELIKLVENGKAKLVGEKVQISRETGITLQERQDILKEIKSIEGSLQYRAEVDPNQTIQAGDNAPQNLQQLIIPDSQVAITRDRLLYLTKKLKFIEDGGIVQYPGEFSDRYN